MIWKSASEKMRSDIFQIMLKELTYVIKVAEYGSILRASEALYISQPSLSRYIKDLEKNLGIELFKRTNNKLVPTDAGLKYVITAKKMMALYTEMQNDLSIVNTRLSEPLKIGCGMLRMSYVLPDLLKEYIRKFPNVDIQFFENSTVAGLEKMLLNGDINIAFLTKRNIHGIKYIPFMTEELLVAVPKNSPLFDKGIYTAGQKYPWIDIKLLDRQPFIQLDNEKAISVKCRELFAENNILPEIIMDVKNAEIAFHMVEAGLGISIIPETILRASSINPTLRLFSFGNRKTDWTLYIGYREDSRFSKAESEFIDMICKMKEKENL